jgi:histidine phosphotransferase ChpT
MSHNPAALDPVSLSALLASRLCHDLINPVGALGSGLEVLDDETMDQVMRDAALDLIRSSGHKSIALLKYARLAYGAAGGFGAELPMEEAEAVLRELYNWCKAELVWKVAPGLAPKEHVKAVLILAHAAADCAPRGGEVTVTGEGGDFRIEAVGPRIILQDDLIAALRGECEDLKPKFAPAYVAGLLAREAGGVVGAALDGEKVVMRAIFAKSASAAAAR